MVSVPETAPDLVWGYKGEPGSAGAAFDGGRANITRGKLIGGTGGWYYMFSRQNPREMESADIPIVPRFVLYTWSSLLISRNLNYNTNMKEKLKVEKRTRKHVITLPGLTKGHRPNLSFS